MNRISFRALCDMLASLFKKFILFFFVNLFFFPALTSYSQEDKTAETYDGFLDFLWGEPALNNLYLGMWTYHLRPSNDDHRNYSNELIGISYKGYYAGTFINTFYNRSYTAGIQRKFPGQSLGGDFVSSFGYRLGGIYGYDARMMELAGKTPIIPFFQIIYDFSWKWFGIELSYSWVVVSGGFYIRYDF